MAFAGMPGNIYKQKNARPLGVAHGFTIEASGPDRQRTGLPSRRTYTRRPGSGATTGRGRSMPKAQSTRAGNNSPRYFYIFNKYRCLRIPSNLDALPDTKHTCKSIFMARWP